MNSTFVILSPLDVELYKSIRLEALKEDPQAFGSSYEKESAFSEEQWKERIENRDNCIIVAKEADTSIGMIGYHLKDEGKNAHLWGMFVSKKYRGKGIGKQLMQQIVEKAKRVKSVEVVSLDVNPEQTSAVKLYESMGFVKSGTRKYLMGDGIERELFSMKLALK